MAEEELDIILRARDNASDVISGVSESAEELADSLDETSTSAEDTGDSLESVESDSLDNASGSATELEGSLDEASNSAEGLGSSLDLIDATMLMSVAEQVDSISQGAEGAAQGLNEINIQVGQLATMTGMAEGEMNALIRDISNVTFPQEEATMYVKSLTQMGVANENLGSSATNIDKINDAFGLGAERSNRLAQELGVLGVDMNNVSESFNALAYANANTVGGMQNYFSFLQRYDAEFKELGYNVDQSSIIIAAATQKYGGGRAALSGLSDALKEAGDDSRKLEEALGLQAGSLDKASSITGEYSGQLQELANEEMEHKTILERLQAAVDDIALGFSGALTPVLGFASAIGGLGSFGLQVQGLKSLNATLKEFTIVQNLASAASSAYGTVVAVLTGEIGLAEAATMAWNAVLAMNPLVWVAVAAVALAVAVYEVGKAFGWWTDVGSMLEAINAGVQRLWSAFINHPDVQAIIGAISNAWSVLARATGLAISWVLRFFNVNTGGEFDVIRALIDTIGVAWQSMTAPIRNVIKVIKLVITVFNQAGKNGKANVDKIKSLFRALPGAIRSAISSLVNIITAPFRNAYTSISKTVGNIKSTIRTITSVNIGSVTSKLTQPFTSAYNSIVKTVNNIISKAKSIPSNIPIIGGMFGGADLAYGGEDLIPTTGYTREEMKVSMTQDINLSLDLSNVPSNVDENQLYSIVGEAMQSKEFIQALASSNDFQSVDRKVKARINGKRARARGVA